MRLLDAKSSNWAIRHIYVVMALVGVAVFVFDYSITPYLEARNQEILDSISFDAPNWVYYHDGGDATLVFFLSLAIGGGLLILSPIIAAGYIMIRRDAKIKLKGSNIE